MIKKIFQNKSAIMLKLFYSVSFVVIPFASSLLYFVSQEVELIPYIIGFVFFMSLAQYFIGMRLIPLSIEIKGEFVMFSFFFSKKLISIKKIRENTKTTSTSAIKQDQVQIKTGKISFVTLQKESFDEYEELCQLLLGEGR